MSKYPLLHRLRVGCVRYLNAVPLIADFDGPVVFDHPSTLAGQLARGELDAALVPAFELLRRPACHTYHVADGVSVSARGDVYSVFLAYHGALSSIRSVALDQASLSSAHLLQVLLAKFHQLSPDYRDQAAQADAKLLIGNHAIDFRRRHGASWSYLDLGGEWMRCTGLPFVFALWLIAPGIADPRGAAEELRALKQRGHEMLPKIIKRAEGWDEDFRRRYLTQHIHYDLDQQAREGLSLYRQLLAEQRLIESASEAISFV